MTPEPKYRQMELNPRTADGEQHSPEQVRLQMEKARQQAEFFEAQRAQWEAQRQALEQSNEQKALFNEGLNDVGMKLHYAVQRMDHELDSMKREYEEVSRVCDHLKRHLKILSSMQPEQWSTEGFSARLHEALPKLERAESDFNEIYASAGHYKHTDIFTRKPGEEEKKGLNWKGIRDELLRGLAFHFPLFLLLLISWAVYHFLLS